MQNTTENGFLHWFGYFTIQIAKLGGNIVFVSEDLSEALVGGLNFQESDPGLEEYQALVSHQRLLSRLLGLECDGPVLRECVRFRFP